VSENEIDQIWATSLHCLAQDYVLVCWFGACRSSSSITLWNPVANATCGGVF